MAESQRDSERKGVTSFKSGSESVGGASEEQVMVTIQGPRGRIVKVERVDKSGKRQDLVEEEWTRLVGRDEVEEIEAALEEAFEAGVAAVLGEEYEDGEGYENDDESTLRRFLVGGLLRRSVRRRILERLLLSRMLRGGTPEAGFSSRSKPLAPKGA
jgi:hypothetical protein